MNVVSLLIDLGGTYIKSCTVDRDSRELLDLKRINMPPLMNLSRNRAEISKRDLKILLDSCIGYYTERNPQIDKIFISGQMGCYSVSNKSQDNETIISWQDSRAIETFGSFENISSDPRIKEISKINGNEIGIGVPAVSLFAEFESRQLKTDKYSFISLINWCGNYLTGKNSTQSHVTDAAASGLVNIFERDWITDIFSPFGAQVQFPKIASEIEPIGNLEGTQIEVFTGVGDQQASLLGVGISHKDIVINIGTGGQVARMANFSTVYEGKLRPFFSGNFISTVTHLPSGRFLENVLAKASVTYEKKIDFEYLNNIKLKYKLFETDPIFENFPEKIPKSVTDILSLDEFLSAAIEYVASQYVAAIQKIGIKGMTRLIFAGGVGQKCLPLSQLISASINELESIVSKEMETTLSGLRKISTLI